MASRCFPGFLSWRRIPACLLPLWLHHLGILNCQKCNLGLGFLVLGQELVRVLSKARKGWISGGEKWDLPVLLVSKGPRWSPREIIFKGEHNKENNVVGGVQQQEDHLVDGWAGQRWQDLHRQDHRGGGGDIIIWTRYKRALEVYQLIRKYLIK